MIMAPDIVADAVIGLLVSVALFIFWLGPRRWLATDYARNDMFAAREEFFDEAAAGRVSFTDTNYRRVREAINSNIRFAHAISIVRIVLHLKWLSRHQDRRPFDARAAANAIANPVARWAAHRALNKVENAALRMLFLGSPILGVLLLLWLLISNFRRHDLSTVKESLRGELKAYSEAIQAEALTA
jgi:hypothetical protein